MTGRTRRPALAAPRRRVVAGIPTYYVDGPPPARCALMFRVGRSDETLPTLGITHLIEHLALFGLEGAVHSYNGFVDPNRTVFHASGTEDECLEFLADVTGALMDLPMDRLEQERQVLAAEEEGRGGGMFTSLATVRFGAKGFGLVAYEQFGANTVGPDAIRNWVASRFNAATRSSCSRAFVPTGWTSRCPTATTGPSLIRTPSRTTYRLGSAPRGWPWGSPW